MSTPYSIIAWFSDLTFWQWTVLIVAAAMMAFSVYWARRKDRPRDDGGEL